MTDRKSPFDICILIVATGQSHHLAVDGCLSRASHTSCYQGRPKEQSDSAQPSTFSPAMAFLRLNKPFRLVVMTALCVGVIIVCLVFERSAVVERYLRHRYGWTKDTGITQGLSRGKENQSTFPWKQVKVKEVDCAKLLAGEEEEFTRSTEVEQKLPPLPTAEDIAKRAKNCSAFQREYGFIMSSLTEEERNFSIAYSILVFKDAFQVAKLLRAIYRPQNIYCIHVDKKSDTSYRQAIAAMADCFDNVFLTSRSVDVLWGTFTVLEPDLICMQELWRFKKWKYFINLTGQEFPLRTNWELVHILTAYNGANDLEGTVKRASVRRWMAAGPPPHGIVPVKGSVHIAVNRDFVDFVLHSPVAQDLLKWSRRTGIPDETFFSTLNHNPQLGIRGSYKVVSSGSLSGPGSNMVIRIGKCHCPGCLPHIPFNPDHMQNLGCTKIGLLLSWHLYGLGSRCSPVHQYLAEPGAPETDAEFKPFLTRFKNWGRHPFAYSCAGRKRVRQVCILSTGDLPLLDQRPEMFANKFYQDYSRVAIECLHERLYNHTRDEFLGRMDFNTSYYKTLPFLKNVVTAEEAKQKSVGILGAKM